MKFVICIPSDVKKQFDKATEEDLYGCYYDRHSIIGNAIKTARPFLESDDSSTKHRGHWINICDKDFHDYRTGNKLCFRCSECNSEYTYSYNYCPNCGAMMIDDEV